jgi:hypothetical protein
MSGRIGKLLKKKELIRKKKMKKLLLVAIIAVIVLFCSASTAAAKVYVKITPDELITCPQISEFWFGVAPCEQCHADKTVTYTVTAWTDSPAPPWWVTPVLSVSVIPGEAPAGWFSWLNKWPVLPLPVRTWSELLNVKVPLTLGKDAGGVYTFTVVAVDWTGSSASTTATLIVQDHDYVSETLIAGTGENVTLNRDLKNMAVAVNVKKHIAFTGEVECLTENEYVIMNARGNNANYEQESVIFEYKATSPGDYLIGDEQFKSSAVMGGTGVKVHEHYEIPFDPTKNGSMESRCVNLNHHVTGAQRWKTELCTYNDFTNGYYMLESGQSVPCTRSISNREEYIGDLMILRHEIYRRP